MFVGLAVSRFSAVTTSAVGGFRFSAVSTLFGWRSAVLPKKYGGIFSAVKCNASGFSPAVGGCSSFGGNIDVNPKLGGT